jgi:hypothetical protein
MNNKKKEVVGKKYFLIVFGVFTENQKLITDLLNQFEPILSSNFLKFHFGHDYVIAHFETEETQKDVINFCELVLSKTLENYILVPNNKNIFVSLPKELKDFLCNLDENQDTDIMSDIDEEDDNHDMMEQILKKMFSNKKEKETVKLSLDELLDKIASNGIENLTKEEKQQLYDYSERI